MRGPRGRAGLGTADEASALLAETFDRIARWWIEGAALPVAALEADIDRAIVDADLEAARTALAVYEQAAAEACAQRAAR